MELIAFVIMSTSSSAIMVYNFYNNTLDEDSSKSLKVLGIIALILLIIGNIFYFISAYFSYRLFKLKFFEKLGSKVIVHSKIYYFNFRDLHVDSI